LCPQGIFLPGSTSLYLYTSRRIFEALGRFSPRVEPASIDEAYVEVDTEEPVEAGKRIQASVEAEFGLTASLGISDSKYLAKVCSSFEKPRGLTLLLRSEVELKLWSRPVEALYGVGAKTAARLQALGFSTIGDLARARAGGALRRHAWGEGSGRVTPPDEAADAKSIGHEHTLERDLYDRSQVESMLYYLAQKVGRRARRAQMAGRRVVLKLRDRGFNTITHGRIVPQALDTDGDIFRVGCELLEETRFWERGVRLLGVSLQMLVRTDAAKQLAFEFQAASSRATPVVDRIKTKYGENAIGPARILESVPEPSAQPPRPSFFLPKAAPPE
jgi:DNA polymerase-4